MSDFSVCFQWMLQFEDPNALYSVVPDVGGQAISGINSHDFPSQFGHIASLPQNQRGPAVMSFYRTQFWNPWLGQIVSDEVAKRVFDAAVNMGEKTAVKLLQESVLSDSLIVDGELGPTTVKAVNTANSESLVGTFKTLRLAHYTDIVTVNPSDTHYLGTAGKPGPWRIRATA